MVEESTQCKWVKSRLPPLIRRMANISISVMCQFPLEARNNLERGKLLFSVPINLEGACHKQTALPWKKCG